MREVSIIGVGMTSVGEHWDKGLRTLAVDALHAALQDAHLSEIDALYIGNAFGAPFSSQAHLGALIADHAQLSGIEAFTVEAADASGGAALRAGYLAIASGLVNTVAVVGVEKSTDAIGNTRVQSRGVGLDADFETAHGATLPAMAALLMRRYMHEYSVALEAFEGFSINAHANGKRNPQAMFRNALKAGAFNKSPMVAEPVGLFDGAPDADGAAAVILTASDNATSYSGSPVRIIGSAAATDSFALQDREDILHLKAVELSTQQAYRQAGATHDAIDLLEIHDSFTILSTLTLEAMGFAGRGEGWQLASDSGHQIGLNGTLPISTFGGLKSRGNPAGATGIYQAVEAVLQLRGAAEDNQVHGAKVALIQNLGGVASTCITHILAI